MPGVTLAMEKEEELHAGLESSPLRESDRPEVLKGPGRTAALKGCSDKECQVAPLTGAEEETVRPRETLQAVPREWPKKGTWPNPLTERDRQVASPDLDECVKPGGLPCVGVS